LPKLKAQSSASGQRGSGVSALPGAAAPATSLGRALPAEFGQPLAASNGDFWRTVREFEGDPSGLPIVVGELVSGPAGRASFLTAFPESSALNEKAKATVSGWPFVKPAGVQAGAGAAAGAGALRLPRAASFWRLRWRSRRRRFCTLLYCLPILFLL
jgi:hypothetical protein